MNKATIITLSVVGAILLIVGIFTTTAIGSYNGYTRLENKAHAVQVDNTNVLDNTRKMIREAATVSDKEVDALVKIVTGYTEGRGSNGAGKGALVTVGAVTEAVPNVSDIKTLKNLQNIIVAGRKDWQNSQTRLTDIKRQADDLINTFPSNIVLGVLGKEPIEIVIVTSAETKENFRTGEDNENWVN